MSDALYNEIVANQSGDDQSEQKVQGAIWLVFRTGSENYAIDSAEVKEIVRNTETFPIPFVPSYVKGVLNSYGTPYAVIDLSQLLGEETTAERLYLILKNKNNIALQIADIQEFHPQSEVEFHGFSQNTDDESGSSSRLFLGTISFDSVIAPALNAAALIEKVRSEIGS